MTMLPLAQVPEHQAARLGGDRWCVRHGDDLLTWAALGDRATRRAHALAARGVGKNDVVVIALPNGNALYELTFATWKLGATPCVVSAAMPAAELSAIVALAEPRAVFGQGDAGLPGSLPADFGRDHPDATPLVAGIARHWKIIASGGSTGRPKLIVAGRPAAMDPSVAPLGLPADSCVLNPGPCYHNMPFAMTHTALLRGNAVVGMPRFDAAEALRLIELYRAEWVTFVPTMMRRIWALPPEQRESFDLSSMQMVWHTAAPMPTWLKRAWIDWLGPERIFEVYGGSEGVGVTVLDGAEWLAHPGSVGRPSGCAIEIRDEKGEAVAAGEIGEIFIRPVMAEPGETFHYLGAKIACGPGGGVSLGDRGWLDADGFLYIAGRRTDLILSGGANVYPAEIENVLSTCPGVGAAVVIGLPDEDMGERIHALIEPLDGASPPSEDDLRAAVAAALARAKWPLSYEFVAGPLRDAAGKIRRSDLRDARR